MIMHNKKGMTLTELLVSIVMLSVSLILMFGLMSNLQEKKRDVDSRSDDLVIISDIEQRLQENIMDRYNIDFGRADISAISEKRPYSCDSGKSTCVDIIITNSTGNHINKIKVLNKPDSHGNTIINYDESSTHLKWTIKGKKCEMSDDMSMVDNIYLVITCYNGSNKNDSSAVEYIKLPIFSPLVDSIPKN